MQIYCVCYVTTMVVAAAHLVSQKQFPKKQTNKQITKQIVSIDDEAELKESINLRRQRQDTISSEFLRESRIFW